MIKVKRYDESFKQDAVKLAISSNQSLTKTSKELGVSHASLCKWVKNQQLGRYSNLSDKIPLKPEEIALKKVLRELAVVSEERDILKKALGIFSQPKNK